MVDSDPKPTWQWFVALIGVILIGSWCPEALGQTEKEIRLEPLKSAPLEVLSRKHIKPKEKVGVIGEVMPELIGGGLGEMISQIRYPASARMNGIEGIVFIQFVVDEQGLVEQAVVAKGIGGGCDEEALRVVNLLRFNPGMFVERTPGGAIVHRPVKVPMSLPITFKL